MDSASVTIGKRGIERILSGHPWIYRTDVSETKGAQPGSVVTIVDHRKRFWGQALYSSYLVPFEIASVILLVGLVGAVMLGKKSVKE